MKLLKLGLSQIDYEFSRSIAHVLTTIAFLFFGTDNFFFPSIIFYMISRTTGIRGLNVKVPGLRPGGTTRFHQDECRLARLSAFFFTFITIIAIFIPLSLFILLRSLKQRNEDNGVLTSLTNSRAPWSFYRFRSVKNRESGAILVK